MAGKTADLTGQRLGKLTVLKRIANRGGRYPVWSCRCDCGRTCEVLGQQLKCGITVKCVPPYKRPRPNLVRLGFERAVRQAWENMMRRCYDPGHESYARYGGRGISVCDRWRNDIVAFAQDMGPKPEPEFSLDRINPEGNYEPMNCRWADPVTQAANKRTVYRVVDGDRVYSLSAFAKSLGIDRFKALRRAKGCCAPGSDITATDARKLLLRG